jgi:dTDP-D-glucose 4,6-dehydratase
VAKERLNNWNPQVHLEEGLKKTISYFEEILTSHTHNISANKN